MFENVPGIKEGLHKITGRLESLGYRIWQSKRSTSDIGGPHLRQRVWLIADSNGEGFQEPRPARSPTPIRDPRRTPPGNVWVASARRACGLDDGFSSRVDMVRAFGNSIDPWVAKEIVRAYLEASSIK
jgi:site-specific DNA-cytosine methylase